MIGKLKGLIDSTGDGWAIVDVGGVGYHVSCSARTLDTLRALEGTVTLYTEMLVSQDAIRLIGFATPGEREWFKLLQIVQGVGSKVALSILSTLPASELANAIAVQDKAMIGRAPGVGKKLAERIVLELKDKSPAFSAADAGLIKIGAGLAAPQTTAAADSVSALTNLGYGQAQAAAAVAAALKKSGGELPAEKLIRLALRELALA